jgi:cysteine desulfurase/selenocysteine lyase
MTPTGTLAAVATSTSGDLAGDMARLRRDFPILQQQVHGRTLVYLDNAATTQKPRAVIDALTRFYTEDNANVHRGVHLLSERATLAYERARVKVQRFLNARDAREIVFVRGATEAINLVAQSYGRVHVGPGDEVLISAGEHHSNIVPWQMLCAEKGARLRVIPVNDAGELRLDEYERLLTARTRLVAVVHVSNALGTINPIPAVVEAARRRRIPVLVDGAQAVAHMRVDVQELDADFYTFSGHKLFGPTGIGALYARAAHLEAMPPYQGGGDMISTVTFEETQYNTLPYKFEAGTPDIAGAIGLAAALDYVERVGLDSIAAFERELVEHATDRLSRVPGLRLLGPVGEKAAILSFVLEGVHPHDVGTILDQEGVAIRTGHHCCQPLMQRLGVDGTARASFAFYNTKAEVEALAEALGCVREVFG